MRRYKIIFAVLVICMGCNNIKLMEQSFADHVPYTHYVRSLEKVGLSKTSMGKAWIDAGQKVFRDSVLLHTPIAESGYFNPHHPSARAYLFDVKEGQVLTVDGWAVMPEHSRVFVDLFSWKNGEWRHVSHADSGFALVHEFDKNSRCLLRVQPELMIPAHYSVGISLVPALANPVAGATNKSIGNMYQAARSQQKNEGIDIFAPRGTPVIAPAKGLISESGTSEAGGKIIWMQDSKRGQSYYFAHLDSQRVTIGEVVKQGDTLGWVGNTGIARTSAPRLHFGIYKNGSKDALNYVRTLQAANMPAILDTTITNYACKVVLQENHIHNGPGEEYPVIANLEKETYVQIIGQRENWYRVVLADHREGYLYKTQVDQVGKGKSLWLSATRVLLSEANTESVPLMQMQPGMVQALAWNGNYVYVKTKDGHLGWVVYEYGSSKKPAMYSNLKNRIFAGHKTKHA